MAQYANPYNETVSVRIRDAENAAEQTIVSNRIHPYFVQTSRATIQSSEGHHYAGAIANGHWIDAANLQAGDRLLNDDGSWAAVLDVSIEQKPLQAYNLTVADFNTYFVAANEDASPVWVHNNCDPVELLDNGGAHLDDNTIIGAYGNKFTKQPDGSFKNIGQASDAEIAQAGVTVKPTTSGSQAVNSAQLDSADAGNGSSSFSQSENVIEGEVGVYGDLAKRSVRDGLTPDHIPSIAAVEKALKEADIELPRKQLSVLRKNTNCIVVKTCDHQFFSRTYGGRNSQSQISTDSKDLYKAVEADLDTWEPVWKANNWSDTDIQQTRNEVHQLNTELFNSLGIDYGSK